MIPILHPQRLNWFYTDQAQNLAADLSACGTPAEALGVTRHGLERLETMNKEVCLVTNFSECMASARAAGSDVLFVEGLARFRRRILINFDCVLTNWFAEQFQLGRSYFSDVFDVTMEPQRGAEHVCGAKYHWIPEALSVSGRRCLSEWSDDRAIPWAFVAHSSPQRAAFLSACLSALPPNGLVFCPPLAPFDGSYGLDRATLRHVLEQTTCYIWNSHHAYPYHEGLRAVMAIEAGCVPVKIDPLYATLSSLPWVYPSLDAFVRTLAAEGPAALFEAARDKVFSHGCAGNSIAYALERLL